MPAPTATVPAPTPNMTRSRRVSGRLNSACSLGFGAGGSGTSSTSRVGAGTARVLATGKFIGPDPFLRFPFLRPEDDFGSAAAGAVGIVPEGGLGGAGAAWVGGAARGMARGAFTVGGAR